MLVAFALGQRGKRTQQSEFLVVQYSKHGAGRDVIFSFS